MKALPIFGLLMFSSLPLRGQIPNSGGMIAQLITEAPELQNDSVMIGSCSLDLLGIPLTSPALLPYQGRCLSTTLADSTCSSWDLITKAPAGVWLLEDLGMGVRDWDHPPIAEYTLHVHFRRQDLLQTIRYRLEPSGSVAGTGWRVVSRGILRTTYIDADSTRRINR
jgi:hypothetical protein